MNRRQFSALLAAGAASALPLPIQAKPAPVNMGLSAASCGILLRNSQKPGDHKKVADAVAFLDYCQETFGATGVQISVRDWEEEDLGNRLRARAEELDMFLEGQISLPKDKSDVDRFEAQVKQAKEAGVGILRTVMLNGRRYEDFESRDSWIAFCKSALRSLQLGEAVVARHDVRLALENHKDWRVEEMLGILEDISSAHVGVNLDTGNNIALLEDPMEVVRALAPHAISTHLKDMDLRAFEDGFLLAEVPLGQGFLDLPGIMQTCLQASPDIRFNLEMITRDPLKIPCLDDRYWTTFDSVSAKDLARFLRIARMDGRPELPLISPLNLKEQLEREEAYNAASFSWLQTNPPAS